jgi:heme-degrading monooxygenase HmoA
VLEVAVFDVKEGTEDDFAAAYGRASTLLAGTPGCLAARMTRGVESPSRFVLLVEWDSLDAHLVNFRESPRFGEWRALLGPYFAGPPEVSHYRDLPT